MNAFLPRLVAAVMVAGCLGIGQAAAQDMPAGMPDAKQMSGMPLPVGDANPGTVTVRVIKGSLANPLAGQAVELVGASAPLKATTNETGRAEFTNVRVGTMVKAVAIVAGERLESTEFSVPPTGGIRLMLVATDPEAEKRAVEEGKLAQAPPQPGDVVLGDQSRFVFEFNDEGLSVFNILHIVNTARTPVQPAAPVTFELPDGAEGAALLEESSKQAALAGRTITVKGPFAPGSTLVQFAYTLEYSGDSLTVQQRLPIAMTQMTVLAQKVGSMHLASPQMSEHRDMAAEGQAYIVGQGPAIKAGDSVTFHFTGLPHAPTWPLNVALTLAAVILAAGAWGSVRKAGPSQAAEAHRRKLEGRRDRLFAQLTALEERHREGRVDAKRYAIERRELVSTLEGVYAELDEEAAA